MKLVILLLIFGIITPVFAQETMLSDAQTQLDNQVNQENLERLEQRIFELENNHSSNDFHTWATTIGSLATAVAFVFLGYQTWMYRSEKNHTLRAWVGEQDARLEIFSYINEQGEEKTHEEMRVMTNDELAQFNWTSIQRALRIKNYGTITATDVKIRSRIVFNKKPELKEIKNTTFASIGITLLPNSTQPMTFRFTKEHEDKIAEPFVESYFICEINYKSANSKTQRKKGMLIQLHPTRYAVLENWDESTKI